MYQATFRVLWFAMKLRATVALVAAAFVLTACGGADAAAPTSASAPTTTSASERPVKQWSDDATDACRTFVNGVPNMKSIKSLISRYDAGITEPDDPMVWGIATSTVAIPKGNGMTAEPEVYQAMDAVMKAIDLPTMTGEGTPNLHMVRANAEAFSDAIAVCNKVGVIA